MIKTLNNEANKARFFALYIGQKVLQYKVCDWVIYLTPQVLGEGLGVLSLRSIESLTDEEAKHIAAICNNIAVDEMAIERNDLEMTIYSKYSGVTIFDNTTINFEHYDVFNTIGAEAIELDMYRSLSVIDYLRSISILIPWMEYSREDILELGWAVEREGE